MKQKTKEFLEQHQGIIVIIKDVSHNNDAFPFTEYYPWAIRRYIEAFDDAREGEWCYYNSLIEERPSYQYEAWSPVLLKTGTDAIDTIKERFPRMPDAQCKRLAQVCTYAEYPDYESQYGNYADAFSVLAGVPYKVIIRNAPMGNDIIAMFYDEALYTKEQVEGIIQAITKLEYKHRKGGDAGKVE